MIIPNFKGLKTTEGMSKEGTKEAPFTKAGESVVSREGTRPGAAKKPASMCQFNWNVFKNQVHGKRGDR